MGTAPRHCANQAGPHSPQDVCEAENGEKYLKAQANANVAEVAFVPGVQKLVRVHHYGLRDRVNRRGTEVKYAERPLLGVNKEIKDSVLEALMHWLYK